MYSFILVLISGAALLLHKQPRQIQYRPVPVHKRADTIRVLTKEYQILLLAGKPEGINIVLQINGKEKQRFTEPSVRMQDCPDTAYVADINGDQQPDVKFLFNFSGASPLSRRVKRKIYLISSPEAGFTKLSFFDFSSEPETDFNGENAYEIMAKELISFKNHSYWKSEIYSFSSKKLVNVSSIYGYPKLVPFRNKPTRKPVAITDEDRRILMSKRPQEYTQQ